MHLDPAWLEPAGKAYFPSRLEDARRSTWPQRDVVSGVTLLAMHPQEEQHAGVHRFYVWIQEVDVPRFLYTQIISTPMISQSVSLSVQSYFLSQISFLHWILARRPRKNQSIFLARPLYHIQICPALSLSLSLLSPSMGLGCSLGCWTQFSPMSDLLLSTTTGALLLSHSDPGYDRALTQSQCLAKNVLVLPKP